METKTDFKWFIAATLFACVLAGLSLFVEDDPSRSLKLSEEDVSMLQDASSGELQSNLPMGDEAEERPLPLIANWNCNHPKGYGPEWQWNKIQEGHQLLFTYRLGMTMSLKSWKELYKPIFEGLAERQLPICLRWGNLLDDCDIKDRSPFGPLEQWRLSAERRIQSHSDELKYLQEWYPAPSCVVMLSNNEGTAPSFKQVLQSQAYLAAHGENRDAMYQEKMIGSGYVERYNAMFDGMRGASGAWGEKMRFIGYAWGGQSNINMYDRLVSPLAWDGVSARNYVARGLTDFKADSTVVCAMNLRLKQQWYAAIKKDHWFEVSPWWRKKNGISPARYGGMVTWALWVSKPNSLRQFSSWGTDRMAGDWEWYRELFEAVDQVHQDTTLRHFWKHGHPVINQQVEVFTHVIDKHPGQGTWAQGRLDGFVHHGELERFESMSHHYYALPTSLDPPLPARKEGKSRAEYDKNAIFPVWAQAQVTGSKPERSWLIFAYAPRGDRDAVTVTLPGLGPLRMDIPQRGVFVLVQEKNAHAKRIEVLDYGQILD
ncbi:MAG: hypothetical protein P8L18_10325 [Verrucomicrobiota bacterium]|nr:hypothetical protein [Verrucomicrobiota bacterium]